MKDKYLRSLQGVLLGGMLLAGASAANAGQIIRETWDGFNLLGNVYPANQAVTNGPASVGFVATSPWITNPAEHDNNTLISIRAFFPEYWSLGLPPTLYTNDAVSPPNWGGTASGICQDNSFQGNTGPHSLWTAGDWMVRQLTPASSINFDADGEYFLSMHVGMDGGFAQYVGALASTGAGGIGFADGATTNAHFVAMGCSGTNVYLGPPDVSNPDGTINAGKSLYVSQGTLGQPGNPNSLLYHGADGTLTNFTGGPYYINAFSTNRANLCQGDGILVLGHLITRAGGNATMEAKFYNPASFDTMDITTNGITWDCSYSFNYTGTMSNMLVFENGQFPLYIYDFRVGTSLADVVGMDCMVTVTPRADLYAGFPLNLTNYTGMATPDSNPTLFTTPNYGIITYRWQQNGTNITDATNTYFSIASVSTTDPSMPAGSDAGSYTCISTDESGTWGSITSAPVLVTITVDNVPPTVSSVTPSANLSTVKIVFSEPVNGADVLGHYAISGGLSVTNVSTSIVNNQTVAMIQTTAQPLATNLTLTFSSVTDLAGNPLTPNTANFWSFMYATGNVDYDAWYDTTNAYGAAAYFSFYSTALSPTPPPGFSTHYSRWEAPQVSVTPTGGGPSQNQTYGAKMYGWFIPPVTTNYVFFVSADDACRLSLSTNDDPANLRIIAVESLWSPADSWTNYSMLYNSGPHRGDGTSTNGTGTTTDGWDLGPDQNRSDEFIAAYTADVINSQWPFALASIGTVTGFPSTMDFWPNLDANGNALITLQAGQKYYIQADHNQQYGGGNLSVTYKFANNPGDRTNDPATGTPSIMTGSQIAALVPFQAAVPTLSISNSVNGPVIIFTGTLAASPNVEGPYIDVPSAVSPYHPTDGGTMFFRSHN